MTEDVLVRNAADSRQVKKARRKSKLFDRNRQNDLRAVLATAEGRRFLWHLISDCGVYRSSYMLAANSDGVHFHEGRRDVGLQLIDEINQADPELLPRMGLEAVQQDVKRQAEVTALHSHKREEED